MGNFIKKDDSLGSLMTAVREIHNQQNRDRNRQSVINEFDKLDLYERKKLYKNYKRNNHDLCFITEYDKLSIMGFFKH